MARILLIFGTRPEIIKLAPIIHQADVIKNLQVETVHTGQHLELAEEMLEHFSIVPDHRLGVMKKNQNLFDLSADVISAMKKIIDRSKHDLIMVQGDTTSVFLGALGAFYCKIPVAHVEAGLRTNDRYSPFPEEMNRRLTSQLASLHFAPTKKSRQALINEGIADTKIFVTGNTVIDALKWSLERPLTPKPELKEFYESGRKTLLVTTHRRENFGERHQAVFEALLDLVKKFPDVQIFFPIHLNPNVRAQAQKILKNHEQIKLVEPLGYKDFIWAMQKSFIILTDSGGVQEEAPSLDKPVIVLRESTERTEGVEAGCLKLVGTDREKIVETVSELLTDSKSYEAMANKANPFGDGNSARRIIEASCKFMGL
jgi:UDP-N-acetylglucosamine 2-epimerase (non-hydrolysing)